MMGRYSFGILILFTLLAKSCFEEDSPVPPYVPPDNVATLSTPHSMYTHQAWVNLGNSTVIAENEIDEWMLAFESADSGYHVRINSGGFYGLAHTGSTNFDSVFEDYKSYDWQADKADGNPDSTAVGDWVTFAEGDTNYSDEVMLAGKFDGINYIPVKKFQFIHVDDSTYRFITADPGGDGKDTVVIRKDDQYLQVYYSADSDETIFIEPPTDSWDLMFGQYLTILYTDDGIATPYYVRGVLTNPARVRAVLDTTLAFNEIDLARALTYDYPGAQDIIGHDWKSVTVDEGSNSAEYKVRPDHTYVISVEGTAYYKLRFKSYFNEEGLKGWATVEVAELE